MFRILDVEEAFPTPKVMPMEDFLKLSKEIDERFSSVPKMPPSTRRNYSEMDGGLNLPPKQNFDHLIGAICRRADMVIIGQICKIEYYVDSYNQHVAMAHVAHFHDDDITEVNCLKLNILH